jgi:hypothetical protein
MDKVWFILHPYLSQYHIPGTRNLNKNIAYSKKELEPKFQELLEIFQSEVIQKVDEKKPFSYYKFGDGDFYFLNAIPKGSAKPGNRAISKVLTIQDLNLFRLNANLCDRYLCEIPTENRHLFSQVFPQKAVDFPAEIVYGLVANTWLTSNFSKQVGVIGADAKIELLQVLMSHPEYQEYLKLEKFSAYLKIPQKYACDNHAEVYADLKKRILESNCKLFLAGVGHLKSAILAPLAKETGSVIIDIGSGIDALSGVITNQRPYFAGWTNFQVPGEYDYSRIDYLQYRNSRIKIL